MKTMLISDDINLIEIMKQVDAQLLDNCITFNGTKDPLDIVSFIYTKNPVLLIIDDDFLAPNTAHILRSIKKVRENIYIIFITSDPGIDLGREISQIGIHYYAYKPLSEEELVGSVKSITKLKAKKNHFNKY
jgi:DNA-binding NtrC family response regulator